MSAVSSSRTRLNPPTAFTRVSEGKAPWGIKNKKAIKNEGMFFIMISRYFNKYNMAGRSWLKVTFKGSGAIICRHLLVFRTGSKTHKAKMDEEGESHETNFDFDGLPYAGPDG